MIVNRLITTQGNNLRFHVNHTVNGEQYELKDGERYYMAVASESVPDKIVMNYMWDGADFDMEPSLEDGIYVFEISLDTGNGREVIIPALDERNRPLNQLIILRRLKMYD